MIRRISFKFEVISYKPLLDLLNLPPRFSRYVVTPYFTTIQDNKDDKSFKEELIFISHDHIALFTVIFNTEISFPPSINRFLNALNWNIEEIFINLNRFLASSHFKCECLTNI